MITWYISSVGTLYYGNMTAGDREATPEEVSVLRPAQNPKQAVLDQITELERQQLMPRATREFMLTFMELNAPAEVLEVNPGYQAVKAFDEQIRALRNQL